MLLVIPFHADISRHSGTEAEGGARAGVGGQGRSPHCDGLPCRRVVWLNALGGAYRGPLPDMYNHLRFRKWRSEVLTQWQRTADLPVFRFKGHDSASVRRRVVLYYGESMHHVRWLSEHDRICQVDKGQAAGLAEGSHYLIGCTVFHSDRLSYHGDGGKQVRW